MKIGLGHNLMKVFIFANFDCFYQLSLFILDITEQFKRKVITCNFDNNDKVKQLIKIRIVGICKIIVMYLFVKFTEVGFVTLMKLFLEFKILKMLLDFW